jgi:hypothetical protein
MSASGTPVAVKPRIPTISETTAKGIRKLLLRYGKRQYGYQPGITQVLLPDLRVAMGGSILYSHLHLGKSSALTRLQREMVATVVNGKIGGAA